MKMFCDFTLYVLVCNLVVVLSIPEAALNLQSAADRFQNAVQQQTFQSVLLAIEERLRNLDSIYSMQLSETLKSKMDLYHRKLDSLDTKIIRLESIVMLNLDKISENISTKNYKDDMSKTQTHRKLDSIYDGLSHKINYMERKFEMMFEKIQNKVDSTLQRLERMEEDMVQRNIDIEAELSETLSILEDYKSSTSQTDQTLMKIMGTLNETSNNPIIEVMNSTIHNFTQDFNKSITKQFESLQSSILNTLNISEDTNAILNFIQKDVKEDFNSYANKVADMNMDLWKRNHLVEESLKTIETATNFTRTEVQNGIRALMLQIGKMSGKGIVNNDKASLESLKTSVNLSLEKIITQQELFLESCHRVQMDESQIESEISVMLGKLIDMLETKMATVMQDLKNIEKAVKGHDSRTTRNLYQANTNTISLFEKVTKANDLTEKELHDIKFYVNSLFTFVQDVLPKSKGTGNTEGLLNDISLKISTLIQRIDNVNANSATKWNQLQNNFSKTQLANDKFMKNISVILLNDAFKHHVNATYIIDKLLREIKKITADTKRTLQNLSISLTNKGRDNKLTKCLSKNGNSTTSGCENAESNTDVNTGGTNLNVKNTTLNEKSNNKCYGHLIDVRAEGLSCNSTESANKKVQEDEEINKAILEVFGTPPPHNKQVEEDEQIKKSILDIFGTPPPPTAATDKKSKAVNKKKCLPNWASLINIRYSDNENCTAKVKPFKKRKKNKVLPRFQDEENSTDYEYSDLSETTTELTTEITSTEN